MLIFCEVESTQVTLTYLGKQCCIDAPDPNGDFIATLRLIWTNYNEKMATDEKSYNHNLKMTEHVVQNISFIAGGGNVGCPCSEGQSTFLEGVRAIVGRWNCTCRPNCDCVEKRMAGPHKFYIRFRVPEESEAQQAYHQHPHTPIHPPPSNPRHSRKPTSAMHMIGRKWAQLQNVTKKDNNKKTHRQTTVLFLPFYNNSLGTFINHD